MLHPLVSDAQFLKLWNIELRSKHITQLISGFYIIDAAYNSTIYIEHTLHYQHTMEVLDCKVLLIIM